MVNETIEIYKKDEKDIIEYLQKENYDMVDDSYNYLLNISIRQFTKEMVKKLAGEISDIRNTIKTLKSKHVNDIWTEELDELEKIL